MIRHKNYHVTKVTIAKLDAATLLKNAVTSCNGFDRDSPTCKRGEGPGDEASVDTDQPGIAKALY